MDNQEINREPPDHQRLASLAHQLRRDVIRMVYGAGSGHVGGALSLAEYMAVLYGYLFNLPAESSSDADRIVLSNGHVCAVWYAALARCGHIPLEELASFRRLGSRLQGHPSRAALPKWVEASTGPLGQGFSVANGLALSMKRRKSRGRVHCVLGDGEMQEGQVWEALMTAAHYQLNNITSFISYNTLQIDGRVSEVMNIDPLGKKLQSFGWAVREIDGHNSREIVAALRESELEEERPFAIIGHTVMAKGVDFMEDRAEWHGTCPTRQQAMNALIQLGENADYQDFPLPKERELTHV